MSIIEYFRGVTDKRGLQGRQYSSTSVLLLLLLSRLCGFQGVKASWRLGKGLGNNHLSKLGFKKMPTYQSMLYILQKLDADSVEFAISRAINRLSNPKDARLINIDGKRICGSGRDVASAVHLVSLFRYRDWAVCGQVESDYGGGELAAAEKLIESTDIAGKIITGDALFANSSLCEVICKNGGDYVLTVKNNQKRLIHDMALAFEKADKSLLREHKQALEKSHGRIIQRSIKTIDMPWEYNGGWATIKQISKITRSKWDRKNGNTKEDVFCISSMDKKSASPAQLLACNRGHWAIENRLHRTRDTVFYEDKNRLKTAHTPQINAAISNFAIFLLKRLNHSITAATQACATNLKLPLQLIDDFF